MGLETGTLISQLVSSNPVGGDIMSAADDHLRLIKLVLKTTFPGVGGQGFAIPITSTEAELNLMHGRTANDFFASGTRIMFCQSSAPTGWTQDTSDAANNRFLRVVNDGAGGAVAGTDDPTIMNSVPPHIHGFTTGTESNNHSHNDSGHDHATTIQQGISVGGNLSVGTGDNLNAQSGGYRTNIDHAHLGNQTASHTHTGNTNANSGAAWRPRYANTIICTKN